MTRRQRANNEICLRLISVAAQWALLAFILVGVLALTARAQSTAEVTGATSSGDPIVTINGKKHIAFTAEQASDINDKLDRLAQLEKALPVCQKLNTDYETRLGTAIKDANGWHSLYDGEHQLRLDTQAFVKRPSRFTSWMDKPLAKLLITFVPPIITAVRQ